MILETSRRLRLFTVFILYVAQGIPIGLFWFAIPAWLASSGASVADVGSVAAMTALPWSLKFVNGFLMDRYTVLSMGRRRAWLIGAQLVMVACLLVCAALQPSASDIALLGVTGFIVNAATTFQDVAVDGLAVDIMPEDERGRASGMMFGGQAIGIAVATAITGWAIAQFGPPSAYLVSAILIAVVTAYVVAFRERRGEKLLPWTEGAPHPRNLEIVVGAWWPILKTTLVSLFRPVSLAYLPIIMTKGMFYGVMTGAAPLIAANDGGFAEAEITRLLSIGALVAGILGLTLGGWMADRLGSKRSSVLMLLVWAGVLFALFAARADWSDRNVVLAILLGWQALDTLVTVVALPIAMRLSDPRVAATQFTLYMALSNFGITIGAAFLGLSDRVGGIANILALTGALSLLAAALMALVAWPRRQVAAEVADELPMADGIPPIRD